MSEIKPTAILFVLLTGLSLSARANSDCALLLASSFQSGEPSTTRKFRAYMENLLEEAVLGYGELKNFSKSLDKGILANPVTEEVGLRNYEADVHRSSLQNYVDSGALDVGELGKWASERLAKMERDRSGQETVSEEIREVPDIDVTSRAFWEQVTDRYLKYIPVGEKISGENGMEAIHFAAQYAPLETLKKFIDIHQKDLNVNAKDNSGWTSLMFAARNGNIDAINALVDNTGADVNARDNNGRTPLMYAAKSGNPDSVRTLVKAGSDIDAQDNYGLTPLMHAAWNRKLDSINALVNAGADVNARDNYGWTPLMFAAQSGSPDSVRTLVNARADVNAQDNDGWTPLMFAAESGSPDSVRTLVNADADVNAKNKHGETPLMFAVWYGNTDTVSAFIKAGANVNARDNNGKTPLVHAAKSGNPGAVKALKKASAKKQSSSRFGRWFYKLIWDDRPQTP